MFIDSFCPSSFVGQHHSNADSRPQFWQRFRNNACCYRHAHSSFLLNYIFGSFGLYFERTERASGERGEKRVGDNMRNRTRVTAEAGSLIGTAALKKGSVC